MSYEKDELNAGGRAFSYYGAQDPPSSDSDSEGSDSGDNNTGGRKRSIGRVLKLWNNYVAAVQKRHGIKSLKSAKKAASKSWHTCAKKKVTEQGVSVRKAAKSCSRSRSVSRKGRKSSRSRSARRKSSRSRSARRKSSRSRSARRKSSRSRSARRKSKRSRSARRKSSRSRSSRRSRSHSRRGGVKASGRYAVAHK